MTAIGLRIKASRRWRGLRGLRNLRIEVSTRMAWLLVIFSTLLLSGLIVFWLALVTQTALLSKQLEDTERVNKQLIEQINRKWTDIGEATTDQKMQARARAAGYHAADRVEYLINAESEKKKVESEK